MNSDVYTVFNLAEKILFSALQHPNKKESSNIKGNSKYSRKVRKTGAIINAILDGSIEKSETKQVPIFNLEVSTALSGVDPKIIDPRDTYTDASEWEEKAKDLGSKFI